MSKPIEYRLWNVGDSISKMFYDTEQVMECLKQQLLFNDKEHKYHSLGYDHVGHGSQFLQFTGTKTVGKVKVFEGDIIKAYRRSDNDKQEPEVSEVTFLNGCYMAFNCTFHELYRLWKSDFEVVGNKYENPELLTAQYT